MGTDNELLIKINGDAKQFADELKKAQNKTKDLEKALARAAKVSAAAFIALASAVGFAVNAFSKFEKTFTNVQTLLDKSSFSTKTLAEGIDGLKSGIIALGAASGESLQDLNKGLFDIISATGDAENAMSFLESATQLAIAGGTDVAVAVDGLTTSIKAFGLESSDAQTVAEKFFHAQKGGKTTVEEISSAIGLAASSAANYGVSLDELLAASSAATLAGITTTRSFNGLKAIFSATSKVTKEAAAEAKRLGIQFDSTALRSKGLAKFLGDITDANGFTQKSIEILFPAIEAQGVAFALSGEQASDFKKQLELLSNEQEAAATFADALATKQATTERAMARLASATDGAAIVFGEVFAPVVNAVADALTAAAQSFSSMDEETLNTLATVTKFLLVFSGVSTVMAIASIGLLRFRASLITLRATMTATRIASIAMWGALTLGLSTVITFLPEIINGFERLFKSVKDIGELNSVETLDEAISELTRKVELAKISAGSGFFGSLLADARNVDELQEKLDGLIEKRNDLAAVDQRIAEEKAQREADATAKKKKADAKSAAKRLKDQEKNNKTDIQLQKFLASEKVQLAKTTSGDLLALQQSENAQAKEIGKAAALVNIAIKTAEGAQSAYTALAGIPIIGPGLGIAAAAGVVVFGAEQARAVTKAQDGGIVPGGIGSARDRIPALLEPGELVVPTALVPSFIQSVGRPEASTSTGGGSSEITIGFTDEAFEIIEQKLLERGATGLGSF